jgi:hypothetical protein
MTETMMPGQRAPVVVGFTWTSSGRSALAWALREAAYQHRPVRVVHAVDPDGPDCADVAVVRAALAALVAAATNLGRLNVNTSSHVVTGAVADALAQESRAAAMLVLGRGAARRLTDPVWTRALAQVGCPIAIVRGPARVPDRRPVLVAVDGRTPVRASTDEEALREAEFRGVARFAVTGPSAAADVDRGRLSDAQLVVAELRWDEGDGLNRSLRWVVDDATMCPLLFVPEQART